MLAGEWLHSLGQGMNMITLKSWRDDAGLGLVKPWNGLLLSWISFLLVHPTSCDPGMRFGYVMDFCVLLICRQSYQPMHKRWCMHLLWSGTSSTTEIKEHKLIKFLNLESKCYSVQFNSETLIIPQGAVLLWSWRARKKHTTTTTIT